MTPLTLVLLCMALLVAGGHPGRGRLRTLAGPTVVATGPTPVLRSSWVLVGAAAVGSLSWLLAGMAVGILVGAGSAATGLLVARGASARNRRTETDVGDLAADWELLAVCLTAGLPVAVAVSAATASLAGPVGAQLRRTAGLLALGADPAAAWAGAQDVPALAAFGRAAARSASTGAALAQAARAEGVRLRAELLDSAQARAQRAAVLITGPLGLCFLPAFLVLGITPVVIGLAGAALAHW